MTTDFDTVRLGLVPQERHSWSALERIEKRQRDLVAELERVQDELYRAADIIGESDAGLCQRFAVAAHHACAVLAAAKGDPA